MNLLVEGLQPPFAQPTGPRVSDVAVVRAFANREPTGFSKRLHVEDRVLLVDRADAVALRLAARALLVRTDSPASAAKTVLRIEQHLLSIDVRRIDESTLLGVPVALQLVGLRLSDWDLWGDDINAAFAALRATAAGEPSLYH